MNVLPADTREIWRIIKKNFPDTSWTKHPDVVALMEKAFKPKPNRCSTDNGCRR